MPNENDSTSNLSFDVALSFAGDDRALAEQLANGLAEKGLRVFYDRFFKAELWEKDLYEYLADMYEKRSEYCVMLVSKNYLEKKWTTHERKNAQARALVQGSEYILPIRLDETELPGLPGTIAYLDIKDNQPMEIVDALLEKIHSDSESSLEIRARWVEAEFWERFKASMRFGCCVCGTTWAGPDNIHFCLHCKFVYCYTCVHDLARVSEVTKYRWKCRCGGRVF
jgi:hypothetical protein